jgi:hypothetical protein
MKIILVIATAAEMSENTFHHSVCPRPLTIPVETL